GSRHVSEKRHAWPIYQLRRQSIRQPGTLFPTSWYSRRTVSPGARRDAAAAARPVHSSHLHSLEGFGLIGVGIFILDPLHTACLIFIVSAMSVGLIVLAWSFWQTPHWRRWATFALACGLWPMVLLPFLGIALNRHSGLSPYAGLLERLATSPDIVWGAVMLL